MEGSSRSKGNGRSKPEDRVKPPPVPPAGVSADPDPAGKAPASPPAAPTGPAPSAVTPVSGAEEASLLAALREEVSYLKTATHYRVLGIPVDASQSDVDEAFVRFAQTWHPQKLAPKASEEMRKLAAEIYALGRVAHEVLANKSRRAEYKPARTLVPRKTMRPKTAAEKKGETARPTPPPVPALTPIPPGRALASVLFDDIEAEPDPNENPGIHAARTAMREDRMADARDALDTILTADPENAGAHALTRVLDAIELQTEGRASEAEQALDEAVAEAPTCLEALALKEQIEDKRSDRRHGLLHRILPEAPASKTMVIDAIVLAFSHSEASALVGSDALRMVLEVQYVTLVQSPGTLDLQPLWRLLTTQKGFVADDAIPPLCLIKSWETKLRYTIELPEELKGLDLTARQQAAAKCKVAPSRIAQVFDPTRSSPTPAFGSRTAGSAKAGTAGRPQGEAAAAPLPAEEVKKRKLGGMLAVAAGVAVAASLAVTFGGTGPLKVSNSQLSSPIPITGARQSGDVVGAFLTDTSWLSLPESERRAAVEETMRNAEDALSASELVIMDAKGSMRARAIKHGDRVDVIFPPAGGR